MSNLKERINRIHSNLQNEFKNVIVKELSNKQLGNYLEIDINESYQVKMFVPLQNVQGNRFSWYYSTDPTGKNPSLVERSSVIDSISTDVKDILNNKRFDSDYISSLEKNNI